MVVRYAVLAGRRKVEEARFPLVTLHYGTMLGWTFLVLLTKLGTLSLGVRVDLLALRCAIPTPVLHSYPVSYLLLYL